MRARRRRARTTAWCCTRSSPASTSNKKGAAVGGDLPVFPSKPGSHIPSSATVHAIRCVATMAGEPLVRTDGNGRERQRFGEHACRVMGAQFFAARGVDLYLIQLYARWGSSAILRYVQEAPLCNQPKVADRLINQVSWEQLQGKVTEKLEELPCKERLVDASEKLGLQKVPPHMFQIALNKLQALEDKAHESKSDVPN